MAGDLNRVTLIGRVGKDPEIRSMQNGGKVCSFGLATSESWKKDGEKQEKTQWHNCVVFNEHLIRTIEQYVKKGDKIFVEGALETRKWTGQDGADKYTTEVVLKFDAKMLMLSTNSKGSNASDGSHSSSKLFAAKQGGSGPVDLDDEIPFAPMM